MAPPLYTEVGTCWFTSVPSVRSGRLSVAFISVSLSSAFYCAGGQTRANISPVLGYRVVFGATLNVRQHHRQWANINPALVQSIIPVPTACRYCQHEVLTRAEWILASTSDAGPTFNRHWVGFGLYSLPAVSTTRPACYRTQLPASTRQ